MFGKKTPTMAAILLSAAASTVAVPATASASPPAGVDCFINAPYPQSDGSTSSSFLCTNGTGYLLKIKMAQYVDEVNHPSWNTGWQYNTCVISAGAVDQYCTMNTQYSWGAGYSFCNHVHVDVIEGPNTMAWAETDCKNYATGEQWIPTYYTP
jgi:hypothetical protein